MKRIRVQATPDPDRAPRAFQLLADSPAVEETRLIEGNLGGGGGPTMLFSVDGEYAGLDEQLLEDDAVGRAELTPVDENHAVLLVTLRPEKTPFVATIFDALASPGVVVNTPVGYRDGSVHATLVGEAATLQSVIDAFPPAVPVEVQAVEEFGGQEAAAILSDRQREAVLTGLDIGYYDVPRGATHEDVAQRLGCAPSTASEHLQKAESKLVRAAMEGRDSRGTRAGVRD